jgi:hypothetical protein
MGKIIAVIGIALLSFAWLMIYSHTDHQGLLLLGTVLSTALGCNCAKRENSNG